MSLIVNPDGIGPLFERGTEENHETQQSPLTGKVRAAVESIEARAQAHSPMQRRKAPPALTLLKETDVFADKSFFEGILHIRTKTVQSPKISEQELDRFLNNQCESEFLKFAQANSCKAVTTENFRAAFNAFGAVLRSVAHREFLDAYITRDSAIGRNAHPELQAAFQQFTARLEALKIELEKIGICGLQPGKSINFWSGREGQARAAAEESFSDSDIPLFKFLFDCWGYVRGQQQPAEGNSPLVGILPILFSTIFASYAEGPVHVYMSSKIDSSDTTSVINVDSAFWSAELYCLRNNPKVTEVHLYFHAGKDKEGKDQWEEPLDLKSPLGKYASFFLSCRGSQVKVLAGSVKRIAHIWRQKAHEKAQKRATFFQSDV